MIRSESPESDTPALTGPNGPARPAPVSTASPPALDYVEVDATPTLWVVGAHGGSGESTIAAMGPGWGETHHRWPYRENQTPVDIVLVARTHAAGLTAARRALAEWGQGLVPGVQLHGLALIADAPGRLPPTLRHLADVVAGGAPRCWRIKWEDAARYLDGTAPLAPSHDTKRLLADLQSLTHTT